MYCKVEFFRVDGSLVNMWSQEYSSESAASRHALDYFKLMIHDGRFPYSVNVRITLVSSGIVIYAYHWLYDHKIRCVRKVKRIRPISIDVY